MEFLKRARTFLLLTLPLAALLPAEAHGQVNARRVRGMWFAAGAGIGSAKLSCDGCDATANAAPTITMGVGYTVSPRLQLAAEVGGWVRPFGGDRTTIGGADLVAYLYPLGRTPLVVGVGVGLTRYVARESRGGSSSRNVLQGLGGKVSVGLDLPAAAGITLTPTVALRRSLSGSLTFDDETSDLTAHANVLEAGIVLRWHWGTPIRAGH